MKAPSDNLSGAQLELDVETGLPGLDVDLHHVALSPGRLLQFYDFDRVVGLKLGCDELPSRRFRKDRCPAFCSGFAPVLVSNRSVGRD